MCIMCKVPAVDEISSHTAYRRSFRLDLLLLLLVLLEHVPYLSTLEVCSRQGTIQIHVYITLPYLLLLCVCFTSLSDNESNTIHVIWCFVMLYNCLVSFQP